LAATGHTIDGGTATVTAGGRRVRRVEFVELDLTNRCQLVCTQCCETAGPQGTHGTMTLQDWMRVIREAAAYGVVKVQLIGGEVTLHPHWSDLLLYALAHGLEVEVFSNLYRIREHWWETLALPGVSVGTSWYSPIAEEHDAITRRAGSHARTRANIVEALTRGVPLRASVYQVLPGQHVAEAVAELGALGVASVYVDQVRRVGRAQVVPTPDKSELCGSCGDRIAAIRPDGTVTPCLLASWLETGNVRRSSLQQVLDSERWRATLAGIASTEMACPPADSQNCGAPCKVKAMSPALLTP
jgi:MoaA/NifB/PqqE/SkfB family radical SAM enzyme